MFVCRWCTVVIDDELVGYGVEAGEKRHMIATPECALYIERGGTAPNERGVLLEFECIQIIVPTRQGERAVFCEGNVAVVS